MTHDGPVGVVDSGIGGLPYLKRVRELLPVERFVYFADRESFPYGGRTRDEVEELVLRAVGRLVDAENPKTVVVACNTASVVSLDELRSRFSIPFVGVVPAIKPAAEVRTSARIGVLATERTVDDPYISRLAKLHAGDSVLVRVPAPGLVEMIETRVPRASESEIQAALDGPVDVLLAASVDVVVLGCTHFVHVRAQLEDMLGSEVAVMDSVDGVARQTLRVCPKSHSEKTGEGDQIIVTGNLEADSNYHDLARQMGLDLRQYHAPT